jgi:hypothetical protein
VQPQRTALAFFCKGMVGEVTTSLLSMYVALAWTGLHFINEVIFFLQLHEQLYQWS